MTRLFGTNGIREVVGETFTPPFVTRVAGAIALVAPYDRPVVVGWDGRTSSPEAARLVSSTLALAGHRVVEIGLLPTPAIQYNVPKVGAGFAVIVTASHNPPEYNGLKCIGADGLEAPRETEERIEAGVEAANAPAMPFDRVGSVESDALGAERYLRGILEQVQRARIVARRFRVALDCANGASVPTSPRLLQRLGCRTVTLNGHVDGTFPGRRSEPTEANLADLKRMVPSVGADLGIAHDGDADRAVFVRADGRYVPGETMLAALARDAVERAGGGTVVVPVSTSRAVEDAVAPVGGRVVYTKVGSPSVVRAMREHHAVFGGEDNGGLVVPGFQLARDGAMAAAATLDLLARKEASLEEILRGVPSYHLVKETVACPVALRETVLARAAALLDRGGAKVDTLDGVKVLRPGGWFLVRPSGTEAIFRIAAEAKDEADARALADEGMRTVREALAELAGAAS
ncbi:MAG TPA: phosphoglucosamine mutase [Thermoplasmata archaeon]|nr:phosphoglucosamine mutase [Thermoplasmata archaeon]